MIRLQCPQVIGRREIFTVQFEGQLGALRVLAGFLVAVDSEIELAQLFVKLTRPCEVA